MRVAAGWARSIGVVSAIVLAACTPRGRTRPEKDDGGVAAPAGAANELDYAPFMKASGDAIAAAFAGHLGVAPSTRIEQGGPRSGHDRDAYDAHAAADGGTIEVHFDPSRRPLWVQYRGPAGCLSPSGGPERRVAPADANASVLSVVRRMQPVVDAEVHVESKLHDDGVVWIGVYVWQTYRGETIWHPSVFAIVDGVTGRVCEMRVPRWHLGLSALGRPLSTDVLVSRARAASAALPGRQPPGPPTPGLLAIANGILCREVTFEGPPDRTLCADVVTGNLVDTVR